MPETAKLDFKRSLKALYAPSAKDFVLVEVPTMNFVKVDGAGDPNTAPAYQTAVEWLYSVSYGMKFAAKALGKDYGVPPLEGLWYANDNTVFAARAKDKWQWTMMIMVPDFVARDMYDAAAAKAGKKLGEPPESLRLETLEEGLAAQILHIGSYDDEAPVLKRLHETFIPQNGLKESGLHHEIYLSDPRKVEASKLKTILRQPVKRLG
jgi:hypothetical protein